MIYNRILIPIDGSEGSDAAVEHGLNYLKYNKSEKVVLLHVAKFPPQLRSYTGKLGAAYNKIIENLKEYGDEVLNAARQKFIDQGVEAVVETKVVWGDPPYDIVEEARNGDFDLIIIGSRGLEGVKSLLMGSVSNYVTRNAHCTVTVVRG